MSVPQNPAELFSSTLPQPAGQKPTSFFVSSSTPPTPPPRPPWRKSGIGRFIGLASILILKVIVAIYTRHHWSIKHTQPQATTTWHHAGQTARPDQLIGTGRIYLIQLGPHSDPYTTVELADWLRRKYSLETRVLDPALLDPAAWDTSRHRYVAELLNAQIKREHPDLAADPNAFIFGFTDAAMYSATEPWRESFSQRDQHSIAIISSSGMEDLPGTFDSPSSKGPPGTPNSRFNDRIRRILLKDVAILFWHLHLNNDPGSILYYILNPDIPNNDIYQSDLDPLRSVWGQFIGDPCVVLTYTSFLGIKPSVEPLPKGTGIPIRECENPANAQELQSALDTPDAPPDTAQERVELRLSEGDLSAKHTDFFLPGPVPIRFERATNNQWQMPAAFGISGSHNYDRLLVSHDNMRHITIANPGSGDSILARSPSWLSFLPFNSWRDTNESGSSLVLRWRGAPQGHFDLTRYNGEVDSYMPCSDTELCYLNGYHNSKGESLTLERDSFRRLTSLAAPQGNWLHLTYDPQPQNRIRVTSILDSRGRNVVYNYNARGQLETVTYPSGEAISYTYDSTQNLISVTAKSISTKTSGVLVTNQYEHGKLIRQILADGSTYIYTYSSGQTPTNGLVTVRLPDGTIYDVAFGTAGSAVRQRIEAPLPSR